MLPSCSSIVIPESPKYGDPSDELAQSILDACKKRFSIYLKSHLFNHIETKNLSAIIAYIRPVVTAETLQIFTAGIKNDYRGGSQFEPPKLFKQCITSESLICHYVLQNFEDGFLLGQFSYDTRFISWIDKTTNTIQT